MNALARRRVIVLRSQEPWEPPIWSFFCVWCLLVVLLAWRAHRDEAVRVMPLPCSTVTP